MSNHDEIANVNAEFSRAFDATDIEMLRPIYTDDAWFMVPHVDPLIGKDAILAGIQGLFDSGINAIGLNTTGLDFVGDTAIETGEYVLKAGDNVADKGKYMVVWKKIDGSWKLHRDMINTSLPAPA